MVATTVLGYRVLLMGSPEMGLMRLVARCFWMELRSYVYPSAATTGFVNGTYKHAPCSCMCSQSMQVVHAVTNAVTSKEHPRRQERDGLIATAFPKMCATPSRIAMYGQSEHSTCVTGSLRSRRMVASACATSLI